jgi:hypothetical protein
VAAERDAVAQHRADLARRREALLAELRGLDAALAAAEERLAALAQLARSPTAGGGAARTDRLTEDRQGGGPSPRGALRGPAIRETAVRILLDAATPVEAIHYRRWYERVTEAGYAVAGKDPVAVFLTQITRSPLVRKATEPGVYELDREAPARIERRLDRLRQELREVTQDPGSPADLAAIRARRHELDITISREERALEEALRGVGAPDSAGGERHTAGRRAPL